MELAEADGSRSVADGRPPFEVMLARVRAATARKPGAAA
jgi:hypothetical protein